MSTERQGNSRLQHLNRTLYDRASDGETLFEFPSQTAKCTTLDLSAEKKYTKQRVFLNLSLFDRFINSRYVKSCRCNLAPSPHMSVAGNVLQYFYIGIKNAY
jgi:hypothetical protein